MNKKAKKANRLTDEKAKRLECSQPFVQAQFIASQKWLTSCVPDGTPAPVGFYPTEALSLTGQETDNATQTA